jgi:hypothetical protein
MREGLCAARYAIVCLPRPALPVHMLGGDLLDLGMTRCVPPVTKMILPSKLPMSLAGSKDCPILELAIWSLIAGSLEELYPSSNTVVVLSKIWRKI